MKYPCLMNFIHVDTIGLKAVTCIYVTSYAIDVSLLLLWYTCWVVSYIPLSLPVLFSILRRQIPCLVSLSLQVSSKTWWWYILCVFSNIVCHTSSHGCPTNIREMCVNLGHNCAVIYFSVLCGSYTLMFLENYILTLFGNTTCIGGALFHHWYKSHLSISCAWMHLCICLVGFGYVYYMLD